MTRFAQPLLATLLAVVPSLAVSQAIVPDGHPGFVLAEAIAEQGCVLHQDDVNAVMEGAGLQSQQFPLMAVPLMQDGFLMSTGNGTLTLVNWGACAGAVPADETDADADTDADLETDADDMSSDAEADTEAETD